MSPGSAGLQPRVNWPLQTIVGVLERESSLHSDVGRLMELRDLNPRVDER